MGVDIKLVFGIGINNREYPSWDGKKPLREYNLWTGMLERCSKKYWDKKPTYIGVTCSENFKSYSFFYEWCHSQKGFYAKDTNGRSYDLDKDILVKGNKIYSEDVCEFVPQRVNALFIKRDGKRGLYPVGVCWNKNKNSFQASCANGSGTQACLGSYRTFDLAFIAYKTFKEALIKQVAEEYKEQIGCRVYQALMNYEVNIDD